jgi:predicted negative regulator of RcsB-dependent stress response
LRSVNEVARTFLLVLGTVCLIATPALAADDPVQKAMKAYEKHRYEDAGRDLRAALPSLEQSKQSSAQLTLGMIYIRNAELHRELAQVSAAVNADYLRRLSSERGAGRSRYSDLYLGLALLEGGKEDAAAAPLEKFLAGEGDEKYKTIAKIALITSAYRKGDMQKAQDLWKGIDASDPDVRTDVAAAYSRAGMSDKDPGLLCSGALTDLKKNGKQPSAMVVKNCIGVYGRSGEIDKGFDLLARADLKSYFYREVIGRSKVLSFYDVQLLSNLSVFYLQASLAALERASTDQQLKGFASYYLGEAHVLAGNADQAAKATAVFLASPQMPPQYKNKAMVRQGAIQHQKGKQSEAIGVWNDLIRKQPGDPELLAEILITCNRLRIDCPSAAQTSAAAVESGDGKRFAILNVGLGRYFLGKKDLGKAVTYLETGRDKGNKNKIESNDPLMLVSLSDAYYRTKKFSEALEIYFEMSKQFPQVRQIQEALQGIYSMEHKSAGDVKIN